VQTGKGGGKDRVRKGIMEWRNEILGPIDGLIASYLGGKLEEMLYLRHISGENGRLLLNRTRFLPETDHFRLRSDR